MFTYVHSCLQVVSDSIPSFVPYVYLRAAFPQDVGVVSFHRVHFIPTLHL